MRRFLTGLALGCAICIGSAVAHAQRLPSVLENGDEQAAKDLYKEGAELVESGHAAVGVDKLITAYELSGAALPLFALAHAYSLMLDHERTSDITRVLLEDHESLAPDLRSRTKLLKAEAQKHVGLIRLMGVPSEPVEVTLDDQPYEDAARRPMFFSFLPGVHKIELRDGIGRYFEWEGEVAYGQTREVLVNFADDDSRSVLEEPWFWIATGVAAALAVGAVILIGSSGSDGPGCEGVCLPI